MFSDDRHKNELKHECELPAEDDITNRYIIAGYFVAFRRKLRSWMVIDQNNPRSRVFLKSMFIISREKMTHMNYHYYMIHPFSGFRVTWECLLIVVMISQLILNPLHIIINSDGMRYASQVADVMTIIDIILSFNTGFQNKISNTIILHRKAVAIHYLYTTFIFDLISLWEYNWIFTILNFTGNDEILEYVKKMNYLELINSVKLLRLVTLYSYIDRFRDAKQWNLYGMKIFKVALSIIILILWMSGLTYINTAGEHFHEGSIADQLVLIVICIRRVVYMLYLFGISETSNELSIIISQMVCLTAGFGLNLLILCQMLQIRTKYNWSSKKFYQMTKQMTEYMRYKSLPPMIQSRIMKYCDFRFQLNYYKEQDIMKILSPQLQQEVMLQAHVHLLTKVTLFEDIPMSVLFGIIYQMRVNFYMPSDVIISSGSHTDAMYFINTGSVAVYTAAGKEVCHLSDGDHFGELSLMGDGKHNAMTIVAIDCCEIYVLLREDFMAELLPFTDVYERVIRYMKEHTVKTYLAELVDDFDDNTSTVV